MSELTSDLTHTSQRATTLTNVQLLDGPKVNLRLSGGSILPVDTPDPLDRVIDAKGADLLPPIFDSHVQLSEPGFEHREDLGETVAIAAGGGVCHLLGLPFTDPPLDRPSALYATQERVSGHAGARLSLVASLFTAAGEMSELSLLKDAGAIAVCEGELSRMELQKLIRAYTYAAELGLTIITSAGLSDFGNPGITSGFQAAMMGLSGAPEQAEAMLIERDLRLAKMTGAKIHVPLVTTAEGVELIKSAKDQGLAVTAGTSINYATVSEVSIGDYRTFAKLCPPLRADQHRLAVVKGLKDGTLDCLNSNHKPVDQDSKRVPFELADSGAVGLEGLLSVAFTLEGQGLSRAKILELLSPNPAQIFGLDLGASNSFTLFDRTKPWILDAKTARGRCRNVLFESMPLSGNAVLTVTNGRIVYNDL